ncbi:MAG: tetratricopeptide repeat protein [Nitrospirae bacterium]|nr:tetratricopeptide repeat protein [Nitrospirota bacterium]
MTSAETNRNNTPDFLVYINIASLLTTLFWALHPLRVEAVAWATVRTHCQAVFFLLLSMLLYMKAIHAEFNRRKYLFLMASAFVFYTISVFSYSIGITFFAIYFILDVFLFKRIGNSIGWWKAQTAKKVLLEKIVFAIPAVLIGVISVVVRVKSAGVWQPPVSISEFGLTDRLMQAVYITVYYIYRPFYPVDLAPVYTTLVSFDPLSASFLLSAIGLFIFSLVIFILRKQWPIGVALLLSHIILLIPVMGFFEHPHYPADRYSLLPSICWSVFLAMAFLYFKKKGIRTLLIVCMVVILCFWGVLSVKQVAVWNNSESLFSHTLQTLGGDPYRYDIYWRWGRYLYEKGRTDDAAQYFIKTLQIKPNHPEALYHLAKIEYDRGDHERARSYYQRLLQVAPNYFRNSKR